MREREGGKEGGRERERERGQFLLIMTYRRTKLQTAMDLSRGRIDASNYHI